MDSPALKVGKLILRIREFSKDTDMQQVEELERSCEAASAAGQTSIFTHIMGDPLCRVRSYPIYCMMVAEAEWPNGGHTIVGIIRAGVKQVVRYVDTHHHDEDSPNTGSTKYVASAYLSGLRISRLYRRLGVAQQLVMEMEAWCRKHGAEYSYMATENDNQASVNLFTLKLGYTKFWSPSILVQPVYCKKAKSLASRNIEILKLNAAEAESLYRSALGTMEFFPKDIDAVLTSPFNAGTWIACYKGKVRFDNNGVFLGAKGTPWAMLSLWKYDKLIQFEVRGASARIKRWAALTRLANKLTPWIIPPLPNLFDKAFGVQVMYGLHVSQGSNSKNNTKGGVLLESLCWHAHNLALQEGCKVLVTEIGSYDPLRGSIPHWKRISELDLWCIKRLQHNNNPSFNLHEQEDWCKWAPPPSLFLDPRDF